MIITPSRSAPAISVRGLVKSFGEVRALDGVDLEAAPGTVLGVLGPNGAGKTTAVRVLTTLLAPDAGSARVAGLDVVQDAAGCGPASAWPGSTRPSTTTSPAWRTSSWSAACYGERRRSARRRALELLERFGLADAGGRVAKTYSGGMRRRLDLAAALVATRPCCSWTSPPRASTPAAASTAGRRSRIWWPTGTTVLLTTQYLDEADRLADRIAVIDHGRVIADGTSDQLKDRVGGERVEVKLTHPQASFAATSALAGMGDDSPQSEDDLVRVTVSAREGAIMEAARRLDGAGVGVEDIVVRRPTLDDVFLSLTGHAAETENEREEVAA